MKKMKNREKIINKNVIKTEYYAKEQIKVPKRSIN